MNIVVLCGGTSGERDVSITSGTAVAKALMKNGHSVILLDAFMGYDGDIESPEKLFTVCYGVNEENNRISETAPDIDKIKKLRNIENKGYFGKNVIKLCSFADFVFLALHGDEGENGMVQAFLDMENIRYTGSGYLGSAIAMNKYVSKQLLNAAGIKTPKGLLLSRGEHNYENIGFPCVVKPCSGGSSVATAIVKDEKEYRVAVDNAFVHDTKVLVEEYISGRELTVGVMEGRAMPCVEIVPKKGFYDYKNKYQAGFTEEYCPAHITDEQTKRLQEIGEEVYKALQIDVYCRVDCIMTESGDIYTLEANTLPGMTGTSLIPQMASEMGMTFPELCEKIIEGSMKKYIR